MGEVSTLTRAVSGNKYTVSACSDPAEIASAWRELEADGALTPFQTRAWLSPWLHHIAPACGAEPIFVFVQDAHGRPLMLLPLCRFRRGSVIAIQFQDLGVGDYNAPILAQGFLPDRDDFQRLWAKIRRVLPRADIISLDKMPEMISGASNPMAHLIGTATMRLKAWTLPLPSSREDYDKSLKQFERKELRRKRRNLEAEGALQLQHASSEPQVRRIFEALRRQKSGRGTGELLTRQAYADFYLSVVTENLENGFALLSELTVGGEAAAALYALNHRRQYFLLMHGFEMNRWGAKSPGIVAIDCVLTDRIAAGSICLDFTIGNENYKKQFGVTESCLWSLEQGLSPWGQCVMAMHAVKRFAGRQIRRLPQKYWPKGLRP